jgi:succinoglycan biosynthesis protein ExoO
MPDVSIVIPAWNAASYIDNAVTSALRQDDVSVEVVIVDDASTDDTAAVVAEFDDPRVRGFRLSENRGPAAARNVALAAARGRWVAVLDADDTLLPNRLARLVGIAEANELDIVADNLWIERLTKNGPAWSPLLDEPLDGRLIPLNLANYLLGNLLFSRQLGFGYLKPLFRRSFLDQHGLRYDETLRIGEDFHLMLEALAMDARCARHASAGYIYVTRTGSISHRLSLSDATAMIAADRRFLARFGGRLSPVETRAARLHLSSLTDGAAFVAMVDCIKRRRLMDLVRHAGRHPRAVRHFSMPMRAALARLRGAIA